MCFSARPEGADRSVVALPIDIGRTNRYVPRKLEVSPCEALASSQMPHGTDARHVLIAYVLSHIQNVLPFVLIAIAWICSSTRRKDPWQWSRAWAKDVRASV
jgi:hypothetical protein